MAKREIKTTLKLEGEQAYKKAVGNVNSELKVLSSEMKEVNSRYDANEKSMRKLSEQSKILNSQYEAQQKKVKLLQDAVSDSNKTYDKAVDKYDEMVQKFGGNSKEAEKAAAAVEKAQKAVDNFTIQLNGAEAGLNKLEGELKDVQKEMKDLSNLKVTDFVPDSAIESVEEAQKKLENVAKAAKNVATAAGGAAKKMGEIGAATLSKGFEAGAAALTAYASAATAAGAAVIANSEEFNKSTSKLTASLGLSVEESKKYGDIIKSVYTDNFGESFEDIAGTVSLIREQMNVADDEIKSITKNGYLLKNVYDIEISESIRGANAIVKKFGVSAEEAYNLIAQGAEKGLNQNADLADQIAEYATYYSNLGLSAEDAFNIMAAGAKNGVYQIDKINDAVKEFSIRAIDGSKTTAEGFRAIGLNAEEMAAIFAEGGETSANAFGTVIKMLASMDDKVAQDAAGVALFGTQWEDLGAEAVLSLANVDKSIDKTRNKISEMNEAQYVSLSDAITRAFQTIEFGDEFKEISKKITKEVPELTNALNMMFDPSTAKEGEEKFKEIINRLSSSIGKDIRDMLPVFLNGMNVILEGVIAELPPAVATLLPYLIDGLKDLVISVLDYVPELLPLVADAAITLFTGLIGGLNSVVEKLTPMLPGIIKDLSTTIIDSLPLIVETAFDLFIGLISGLTLALPEILKAVTDLIPEITDEIGKNLPLLVQSGIDLITALAEGIPQALPVVIKAMPEIYGAVIDSLLSVDWAKTGGDIIHAIAAGLVEGGWAIEEAVGNIVQTVENAWRRVGASLYELTNADTINQIELQNKYGGLDDEIIQRSNQYMREGMSSSEALEKAKNEILDTSEKLYYFNQNFKNTVTEAEAANRYQTLKSTGQIGNPDYYSGPAKQNSADYYAAMGRAALAEREYAETAAITSGGTGTGGNVTNNKTVVNNFNSPKALSAQEQLTLAEKTKQLEQMYS